MILKHFNQKLQLPETSLPAMAVVNLMQQTDLSSSILLTAF